MPHPKKPPKGVTLTRIKKEFVDFKSTETDDKVLENFVIYKLAQLEDALDEKEDNIS